VTGPHKSRPAEGWRPRLVALDIDGTIFMGGHGVASSTVVE